MQLADVHPEPAAPTVTIDKEELLQLLDDQLKLRKIEILLASYLEGPVIPAMILEIIQ
jgi:hypothetical protein